LVEDAAGHFARLDYLPGASSLTVCLGSRTAASLVEARELAPADAGNTIDTGCDGGPWTRFTREVP
jgi:hypothetical protein